MSRKECYEKLSLHDCIYVKVEEMPSNERKRKELLKIGTSNNQSKITFAKKSKKDETVVIFSHIQCVWK